MRILNCRDAGFDCNAQIKAETDEEILAQAAEHAIAVHGVTVTSEMADSLRLLIHGD